MLNVVKIRLHIKVTPENNKFSFYYYSDNAYFYDVCYLKIAQKTYKIFDYDTKENNEIYIVDCIFKLPKKINKSPKLSYNTSIYYQKEKVNTTVQILEIEVWKNEEKIKDIIF